MSVCYTAAGTDPDSLVVVTVGTGCTPASVAAVLHWQFEPERGTDTAQTAVVEDSYCKLAVVVGDS